MPRATPQIVNLLAGQNDRANATGLPLGQFTRVRNTRFNEGLPARRPGFVRLDRVPVTGDCLSLPSGGGYARIPTHAVHQLPLAWTLDIVIEPNEIPVTAGGYGQVLGFVGGEDAFTLTVGVDGTLRFTTTDTASDQYVLEGPTPLSTEPEPYPVRIVRKGADFSMWISGALADTRSDLDPTLKSVAPTTDLLVGSMGGSENEWTFEGYVDEFRLFHVAIDGQEHAWVEWADPRYPAMVAYYRFDYDEDGLVFDHSRFGNHGMLKGSAVFASPGLVYGCAPVVGIHAHQRSNGTRKVLIASGEQLFESQVV